MKLRSLPITLMLGAASLAAPLHAQDVEPNCSVFTCMAGISGFGASGGPACTPFTNIFFDELFVWDNEGFDAPATYALRVMYMQYCPGSQLSTNQGIPYAIADTYYWTP